MLRRHSTCVTTDNGGQRPRRTSLVNLIGLHHVMEAPDKMERVSKRSRTAEGQLACVCLRLCEQNLQGWTGLVEQAKRPPSPASRDVS